MGDYKQHSCGFFHMVFRTETMTYLQSIISTNTTSLISGTILTLVMQGPDVIEELGQ